jgi:hypothetical protein
MSTAPNRRKTAEVSPRLTELSCAEIYLQEVSSAIKRLRITERFTFLAMAGVRLWPRIVHATSVRAR